MGVDVTPRSEPEALVYACLSHIELVLATKEVLDAHSVAQCKLRSIEIDRPTLLLGIDEGLSGTVAHAKLSLSSAYLVDEFVAVGIGIGHSTWHLHECEVAGWCVALSLD